MKITMSPQVWKRLVWPLALGATVVGTIDILTMMGKDEDRFTIAVKQGVESVALKEIARQFSIDKHVPVEVIELPYDKLYAEEQRQLRQRPERGRDTVPPFDVVMVDDPWLYSLVIDPDNPTKPRLANLNNLLAGKEADFFASTLRVSRYCPSLKKPCSDYYAVPFVANSQLFAYRASDSEPKMPTTWKQVLVASQRAEKSGHVGYVTRIGPGNSIVTDFMPILWAYDPNSLPERPTTVVSLNDPRPFDALTSLVGTRKSLGGASFDDFDVSAYLQQGRASMGIVWSAWAMMLADTDDTTERELKRRSSSTIAMSDRVEKLTASLLSEDVGEKAEQKGGAPATGFKERLIFGRVPLGPRSESKPELGVWLLAIPKASAQTGRALEFIKYAADLGDGPGAKNLEQSFTATEFGTPPPRKSLLDSLETDPELVFKHPEFVKRHPELALKHPEFARKHPSLIPAIRWSLENARARPRTACWQEIESGLGTYLEKMIEQGVSSQDVIKSANQEFGPLFDDTGCNRFLQARGSK
jgi:ABC-type glycerol-3-phosphate transport system substrate-binding protein